MGDPGTIDAGVCMVRGGEGRVCAFGDTVRGLQMATGGEQGTSGNVASSWFDISIRVRSCMYVYIYTCQW